MAVLKICERMLRQTLLTEKFATSETNLEKVNIVYEEMKVHNLFPGTVLDEKNDLEAIELRQKGNGLFKEGRYLQALENYTRSIGTAKTDKIGALAYANRSNCLYKLKMFRECLSDVDKAFASNYSGENEQRLITRRKEAEKLQKSPERCYEEIPVFSDSEKNPLIQSASNCIKIEENEEFGRCVVAARNIEIGEVISVEKPFTCVLRNDFYVHCHECLKLCYNLIPCNNCTQALYCSEECLEEAQNKYHKYECPILLSISKLEITWILIALKVAILAREDYTKLDTCRFNKNEYYRSDRYKEIHSLTAPKRRGFDQELFLKAVACAIVFEMMKTKTQFFDSEVTENAFKEVLLHQIQVASINGLNIYEYVPASDGVCWEGSDFAGGIYAFSSLYNHSCCRNLFRAYHGSTLVVRATNTIKKGQQCFINYGVHYDVAPLFVRRRMLSKDFFFTCKCRACEEDWEKNLVIFAQAMNLSMTSREGVLIHNKMAVADVDFVKKYLPKFIARLKQCETREPFGEALTLKRMIGHCYETLGNKKRI